MPEPVGRPPGWVLGVDVGGGSVRGACGPVSAPWPPAAPSRLSAPVDPRASREQALAQLIGVARGALGAVSVERAARAVVAIPSFADEGGVVLDCPALPALTGLALAAELAQALRGDVEVVADLAAAATGEATHGTGRGVRRFLCVALGTGANAAAVVDGHLVDTAFGCLGDAGHVLVEPDGPACPAGGRGCLESVTSGSALGAVARRLGLTDARDLGPAAQRGDQRAAAALERAGVALGRAIATWSVMLWPDVVAVAGGVAGAGELLLAPARDELNRLAPPYVAAGVRVVRATLGADATLAGALELAGGRAHR